MSDATPEAADSPKPKTVPPAAKHEHDHDHGHGHGDGHDEHDPIHLANPNLAHHFDTPQQQFDAGKLGIWLFLLTEVLFFAGLFCAYTVYRSMRPEVFVYAHYFLDTRLGALNTCVLLLSSLTAAWAVRNAQLGQHAFLKLNIVITIACACTFMVVKYFEYAHKFHDGLLPGPHFAPTEQVWELPSFKKKHPEAAEYAEHLVKLHEKKLAAAEKPAAAAPAPAASGEAPAATASAAAPAPGTSAVAAAAAPGASAPAAGAAASSTAAVPAPTTPTAAAAPAATGLLPGSGTLVGPAGAQAAAARTAQEIGKEVAIAEAEKAEHIRPTEEQLEPLIAAGIIGPKAETRDVPSKPRNAHVFFSIYFFMTGLHGIHVLVGIGIWVWMLLKANKGVFGPNYFGPIDFTALYWHLVDLIWIYLFPLLYLIH
jgi:cytochrome c oxidase subunit 3